MQNTSNNSICPSKREEEKETEAGLSKTNRFVVTMKPCNKSEQLSSSTAQFSVKTTIDKTIIKPTAFVETLRRWERKLIKRILK